MISLPRDRMDQVVKRFDMLEAQMAAGVDPDAYVKMASEYAELQEMAGRIRALRKAEQTLLDDEAVIPIYFAVSRNLVSPRLTGWVDNVEDFHRIRWMCLKDAPQPSP